MTINIFVFCVSRRFELDALLSAVLLQRTLSDSGLLVFESSLLILPLSFLDVSPNLNIAYPRGLHILGNTCIGIQVSIHVTDMAEAAAIIGLVASIASLVDLSSKIVSRLHEFTFKSLDIPKSFRSLWIRLPLLTATLQHI